MNRKTVEVFCALLKKGWIDRREDPVIWRCMDDNEVLDELEVFKDVVAIDIIPAGNRIYMVPKQDNILFLKNNIDYRHDIQAEAKVRDLYLMNYLSIYLLYIFFCGEGKSSLCRDFVTKEEFIDLFTDHCKSVEASSIEGYEIRLDYSQNFIALAKEWLLKPVGESDSKKIICRYGVINRILIKYKIDELFTVDEDNKIRPTEKLKDLMPYFLRKDRIVEINNWIKEESQNATAQ